MPDDDLHLPNLTIKRFRGIQDLSIEHLGRVTLIAGRNGVGKTTVLDAVRTYAARGLLTVLESILAQHEEIARDFEYDEKDRLLPDWESLFYGRRALPCSPITIGPAGSRQVLSIEAGMRDAEKSEGWSGRSPHSMSDEDNRTLTLKFDSSENTVPVSYLQTRLISRPVLSDVGLGAGIWCEFLGPSVLGNHDIARLWDRVALTDSEERVVEALGLVFRDKVERVAVVGEEVATRYGRRAKVRISGQERPVPLRSLGDGAVRLFGVALALANSKDGFLLLDEAENGIHHTLQRDFWRMVLLTAQANNVQVFATTHSWDCVAGFAQAAVATANVSGALVRLERDGDHTRAVEYTEEDLQVAAEQGIEVR